MQNIRYTTAINKLLADTYTPVSVYLKLRDVYPDALLLESADFRAADNSFSFICLSPLSGISWSGKVASISHITEPKTSYPIKNAGALYSLFEDFRLSFK
jgi:anthranilate synthase component 1